MAVGSIDFTIDEDAAAAITAALDNFNDVLFLLVWLWCRIHLQTVRI